jgi:pyruvate/2-oxoglutarate dehydrogenase complex dihydrolipoamide acyltransferase (E2) component
MIEVLLEGLGAHVEEATIQAWFYEEGDTVNEGDDLVSVSSEEGVLTLQAPATGILAEVYYDEGDVVGKGEVLCTIDEEEGESEEEEGEKE